MTLLHSFWFIKMAKSYMCSVCSEKCVSDCIFCEVRQFSIYMLSFSGFMLHVGKNCKQIVSDQSVQRWTSWTGTICILDQTSLSSILYLCPIQTKQSQTSLLKNDHIPLHSHALYYLKTIGPRLDKKCLRGFRQSEILTIRLSFRD